MSALATFMNIVLSATARKIWQEKEKIGNMVFAKSRCVEGVVLIT